MVEFVSCGGVVLGGEVYFKSSPVGIEKGETRVELASFFQKGEIYGRRSEVCCVESFIVEASSVSEATGLVK